MPARSPERRAPHDADCILIERIFDAPRELVFEAWTDPRYLAAWFAPRGCSIHFAHIDVRPGGRFHSCIRNPAFGECWCVGVYQEIVRPGLIVYSMSVADEQGNRIGSALAGHHPDWPEETIVHVTLEDLGGRTRLVLRQNASEALARETGAYPSWLQMLDRLAESLPDGSARHAI
jgi:uncharacterized protein YndB with AHSA1/START domain